jgi:hypothetical protein
MRRVMLTVAAAILMGCAIGIPAAQASPSAQGRAATERVISHWSILAPAQCRALRQSLHNKTASCSVVESFTIRPVRTIGTVSAAGADASTVYWEGYGNACGGTPGDACESWWVDIHFAFTTSATQAWENSLSCTEGGTNITWCSDTGNGTSFLSMGANFDPDGTGYIRMQVDVGADIFYGQVGPGWANSSPTGWCWDPGDECYV